MIVPMLAVRLSFVLLASCAALLVAGCGPRDGQSAGYPAGQSEGPVRQEVTYERMPDGSIRKTTITKRTVPAPAPPSRPADAYPADPLVRYNVDKVNAYRARGGLPPLLYDARLSAFATQGSHRLARDHVPHANFAEHAQAQHFGSRSAENQGDPGGVPVLDRDPWRNATKQVDIMLKLMMDEGPGGGHYDNIMNPKMRRIGIGNVVVGGRFYMTNDFSD
jgi:uncharacterized protein YkwD